MLASPSSPRVQPIGLRLAQPPHSMNPSSSPVAPATPAPTHGDGTPSQPATAALLADLTALLARLPAGDRPLDALKKPGAWFDHPLTSFALNMPIWVRLPCTIGFENVSASELALASLHAAPVGDSDSQVTLPSLLGARSAVYVLTDDDCPPASKETTAPVPMTAETSPISPAFFAERLQQLASEVQRIAAVNASLAGDGTRENPCVTARTIYVRAPITLGFPDTLPQQVAFSANGTQLQFTNVASA